MKSIVPFLLVVLFFSCTKQPMRQSQFSKITFKDILVDSTISVRAIDVNNERVAFSGSPNFVATYENKKLREYNLKDSINQMDYRGVAIVGDAVVAISAGSPAQTYRITDGGVEQVYANFRKEVFYDALHFFDEQEGIAFGDAMDSCMSVLQTKDGGKTWVKKSCLELPPALPNEGAYAASNTNIEIIGNTVFLASGTRIYKSTYRSESFRVIETPIIQGEGAQGIYSIDFYNEEIGVGFGGDYSIPKNNTDNFIYTLDGGESWEVKNGLNQPGYRSCIQFIPNTDGKGLMVSGFEGIAVSYDFGDSWTQISDEPFFSFRFTNNREGVASGKGRIANFRLKD